LFQGTFALFAADKVGFDPRELGILSTVLGIVSVIIQGCLVGKLVKRFGDVKLIIAGLLISSAGMLLILQTPNIILLYLNRYYFAEPQFFELSDEKYIRWAGCCFRGNAIVCNKITRLSGDEKICTSNIE